MANDDTSHGGDSNQHVDTIAKEERVAQSVGVAAAGRATLALRIADVLRAELQTLPVGEEPALMPLPTDVRLARLERSNAELQYVVYGLLGLFFILFLLRR